jgi:hypothetical protein
MVTPLGQGLGVAVLSTNVLPRGCFFKEQNNELFKPVITKHD